MNAATLVRAQEPMSIERYREELARELAALGVNLVRFGEREAVPAGCDLVWDPGLAGARSPHAGLRGCALPVVATVHGAATLTMKARELNAGLRGMILHALLNRRALREWKWFRPQVRAVIAVSEYGADEVSRALGIERARIHAVYHGVDHATFNPSAEPHRNRRPYFFHVSEYQPKKNLERMLDAYARLPVEARHDFIAVVPRYSGPAVRLPGVTLITARQPAAVLAQYYRGATAFVFASLHESFGMPIIEAMACGCPVITSNQTACAEVGGDAAVLVDPRSVNAIAGALDALQKDAERREELRVRGLEHAARFSWRASAVQHAAVFTSAARNA